MIETSQMQTLVAVARAKSFSKAAEDLNVTQSAISQSIKNLERKIDIRLFKRSGKKVLLTNEGEKLFSLGEKFLSAIEETLDEISNDKATMSGRVRIGTLNGVGKSWLAPELLDFSKDYPDLTIDITLGFQEDLVRDFENSRLDILVLPENVLPPSGERVLLSDEKSTLVYPKGADGFEITDKTNIDELSSLPTILFESNDPLYFNWCRERFGRVPKKVNTRYIVNSHGNMLQAVQQGLGVAVVPTHVLVRSYYKDKVKTLGPKSEVSNYRFYIVYHKESYELERIKQTIDKLKSTTDPLNLGMR